MKALIIDDEIDICYLLGNILKNRDIPSEYATSLSEGMLAIKKSMPSLVFIDNYLPDGRGVELIPVIKKAYPDNIIIMITAHDTAGDRERAILKGVDAFISKPFTKEIIYKVIDDLIA